MPKKWLNIFVYIILACFVVLFLLPSQRFLAFGDGDMFYHIKMTQLLVEHGPVTEFKWLPYTSLVQNYADHHLLYHIIMIPFIYSGNIFIGAKIFHILTIWCLLTVIYIILRKQKLSTLSSLFFAVTPLTSLMFVARIAIQKAAPLAVVFSLLFCLVLVQRYYKLLAVMSALYVYLYGGWPLLVVFVFLWGVIVFFKERSWRSSLLPIGWSILGISAGLIVNPSFPHNIYFYYEQIIKIALVNDTSVGFLASEWLGIGSPLVFIIFVSTVSVFFLVGCALVVIQYKKFSARTLFFLMLSVLFCVLTIKSRRYIEYFVPYVCVFGGILWQQRSIIMQDLGITMRHHFSFLQQLSIAATILIIPNIYGYALQGNLLYQEHDHEYFGYTNYQQAAQWAKDTIPPDEIIFHTLWEEFPMLFYYDTQHRYISGLDPRFLVYGDADRSKKYYDIVQDRFSSVDKIADTIIETFGTHYLLINYQVADNKPLVTKFDHSQRFEKVYSDDYVHIYKL